ncbi:YceI family protein [Desulfohalovibrio reitneri]|uniref:YceI family protein n=1 Tax=Desulfohalovibrio reitneri TaxID=1307759 RepID=UPI0005511E87|nr:YceI family protein [Desulfohalovibrio reitneri]
MPSPGYTLLDPEDLADWLQANPDLALLDVQLPELHAKRRIPGSANACVYEALFPTEAPRLTGYREDAVVVVGCGRGRDAEWAAEKLLLLGYDTVYVLEGGVEAWREAGFIVEGDAPMAEEPDPAEEPLPEGVFQVDPLRSEVAWTGRNASTAHHGRVPLVSGDLRVDGGAVFGECLLDVSKLSDLDLEDADLRTTLVAHLLSHDFLFAEQYPQASFAIDEGTPIPDAAPGEPSHEVRGRLTMRGQTHPVSFQAQAARSENGLTFHAHFDLDRTKWGAVYGSGRFFSHLGFHLVWDVVSISVRLFAV